MHHFLSAPAVASAMSQGPASRLATAAGSGLGSFPPGPALDFGAGHVTQEVNALVSGALQSETVADAISAMFPELTQAAPIAAALEAEGATDRKWLKPFQVTSI